MGNAQIAALLVAEFVQKTAIDPRPFSRCDFRLRQARFHSEERPMEGNLTCAACGRALAETSAWKGSGERFYCNDFCVEADSGDLVLTAYLIRCDAMLS